MQTLPKTYGQQAELRLRLAIKGDRTIIKDSYNRGPLKVAKPFYIEPDTGGVYLCQMCTGGGLAQGDDYYQDIELEPGAKALITTQSSTKIYRMPSSYARQVNRFRVRRGAFLEYIPEPIVPFADSRYIGETEVFLEDGAIAFLAEIIAPGRTSRGEIFQFDFFNSITKVYWNNDLIFWSNQALNSQTDMAGIGLYEGYIYQGSFLIFSEGVNRDMANRIHELFTSTSDILGSASLTLRNGIAVRLLGKRSSHIENTLLACWDLARSELVGRRRPDIRKTGCAP